MSQTNFPPSFTRFILGFMRPKFAFIVLFVCMAMWAIESNFFPYYIKILIDKTTSFSTIASPILENRWHAFIPLFVVGIIFFIIFEIFFRLGDYLWSILIPPFLGNIRTSLLTHVMGQSYRFFSDHPAGSLANKINDLPRTIETVLETLINTFIPGTLTGLISFALFWSISPLCSLVLGSWFTIHLLLCLLLSRKISVYSEVAAHSQSTLTGKIVDIISNIFSVRLFTHFAYERTYFQKYQLDTIQKSKRTLLYTTQTKIILGILSLIELFLIVFGSIYGWSKGYLTAGDIAYLLAATQSIMHSTWWMGLEMPHFFKDLGIAYQAYSLLYEPIEIQDAPNATSLVVSKGKISFKNVCFSYDSIKNQGPLFKDLTVTIKGGEKVGLVGFSGSGKTSFVNLLLRNFDIQSGSISIDNQDISTVTQNSLRQAISVIPQDTSLFHRSLYENIHYGDLHASPKTVHEAAHKAHADIFINKLPQGYETTVGERGLKLSGGQRQRISIARAILKNAPILILDEATSALDTQTERFIQDSLSNAMERCTTLVVAHRLSTLVHMDRILVFDKGQIVEEGTHFSLLKKGGLYALLWSLQVEGFLPDNQFPTKV